MRIILKLYAGLLEHLPPGGSDRHAVEVEVPDDATPAWILERYEVPLEMAHLVLVNGVFVAPEDRASHRLAERDELAVFPPVAGG